MAYGTKNQGKPFHGTTPCPYAECIAMSALCLPHRHLTGVCRMQGAQLLYDQFILPFLTQHAAKFDPVFATTKLVSLIHFRKQTVVLLLYRSVTRNPVTALCCSNSLSE